MHVVVVGCGRSGAALAQRLGAEGDSVSVIDLHAGARDRLASNFTGVFIEGDALHQSVLESAQIERADAFVALSSNDSVNIVVARVARDSYHVPHVLGRLHDVQWYPISSHLGLQMVTTVQMTVDRIHRLLRHRRLDPEVVFGNGESLLVRSSLPDYLSGRRVSEFNVEGEIHVVEITRAGHSLLPGSSTTWRKGDFVSFIVAAGALERLHGFLDGRWS